MSELKLDPLLAFLGNALIAVGALISILCGACTIFAGLPLLIDLAKGGNGRGGFSDLPTVGLVGVIPSLVGVGLYVWGRSLVHKYREKRR